MEIPMEATAILDPERWDPGGEMCFSQVRRVLPTWRSITVIQRIRLGLVKSSRPQTQQQGFQIICLVHLVRYISSRLRVLCGR